MAKLAIKKASTDVTVYVFIQDSSKTTGAGLTGLVYNTTDLVGSYVRPLAARQALSLATLAAVDSAHSDGGFKEIDATNMPGVYRLDLPDAVCATGVNSAVVMLKSAANMSPVVLELQLTDFDLNDASPNVTVADIANDAITAAAYDESTAFPIKKADATTTELARLDSASSYKADVSGLATPTNITAAAGITLAATQGAITWAQQKIVANVESEGALDISNNEDYGIGLKVHGTQFGQKNTATDDWSGAGTYNYGPSGQLNEGQNVGQLNKGQAGAGQRNYAVAGYGQGNLSDGGHGVYNKGSAGYKNVDGFDPLIALEATAQSILADTGTDGVIVASLKNDSITAASLKADAVDEILDEIVVGTYTMRQLLAVMGAALAGKVTGGGTTAITFRGINDASDVIVATVDANGNRSAVTVTV